MRIFFLIMILLTMVGFNSETKSKSDTTFGPHEPLRFIAHAGGQIEGMNYTNSLEALNNSYKNGFRLFELILLKPRMVNSWPLTIGNIGKRWWDIPR